MDKKKTTATTTLSPDDATLDFGPFYHGTKADLDIGGLIEVGRNSNYDIITAYYPNENDWETDLKTRKER